MGVPQTLPANFDQWDQPPASRTSAPPATLPANFDKWDAAPTKTNQPSALSRFGHNFLSGLGVTSDEDAKNFFEHPIHTAMNSLNAQGELAVKARDAYNRGDYKGAVMYGLNYLIPFIGQQTAKAGEQLNERDYAGGIGRTMGVGTTIAAGSPEAQAAASDVASSVKSGVQSALENPKTVATAPIRYAARSAEAALNQKLVPAKPLLRIMTPADEAEAVQIKVPGRDYGLAPKAAPAEAPAEAAPEAAPAETPAAPAPAPKVTAKAVEQQLESALGGQKLVPGVSLRNQAAAQAAAAGKLPEGFTPVESTALKGYKYTPETREFESITKGGQHYVHGDVPPEAVERFEAADSKGKAWSELRNTPGVTAVAKVVNGKRQPWIKPRTIVTDSTTGQPEFSDVVEARLNAQPAAAQAAAAGAGAAASEDLTSQLTASLDARRANPGGVFTSADPAELTQRWGVSKSSIKDTDANLRGMTANESEDYVNQLADSYKRGRPVDPVIETRDADNNIVDVDGRHRALAAERAGVKRIPIIVRRLGVTRESPAELAVK